MDEVTQGDLKVMYVESANGPQGARAAFAALETHFPNLKGRKFYGTFQPPAGLYRACIAREDDDDPQALGLASWVIPGGKFARRKMANWQEHVLEIGAAFDAMVAENKDRNDPSRPSIEFYRSQKDLILLLPIR